MALGGGESVECLFPFYYLLSSSFQYRSRKFFLINFWLDCFARRKRPPRSKRVRSFFPLYEQIKRIFLGCMTRRYPISCEISRSTGTKEFANVPAWSNRQRRTGLCHTSTSGSQLYNENCWKNFRYYWSYPFPLLRPSGCTLLVRFPSSDTESWY